jgi:hypothetical protein
MPDAAKILYRDVYGWFVRVERGIYALSENGKAALVHWQTHLETSGNATTAPAAGAGLPAGHGVGSYK